MDGVCSRLARVAIVCLLPDKAAESLFLEFTPERGR